MYTSQVDDQSPEDTNINKTFSDAVNYCLDVLRRKKYFEDMSNDTMSRQSALLGQKLVEIMENLRQELFSNINKKKSSIDATLRFMEDKLASKKTRTSESVSIITISDSEDENVSQNDNIINIDDDDDDIVMVPPVQDCPDTPDPKPAVGKNDNNTADDVGDGVDAQDNDDDDEDDPVIYRQLIVPYNVKFRVIALYKKNPSWSIKKLSGHSKCQQLQNRAQLERWEKQVKKYGSRKDWLSKINDLVFKKCIEREKNKQTITHSLLCKWALEVKKANYSKHKTPFRFIPSDSWLQTLKKHYNITGPAKNLRINKKKANGKSKKNNARKKVVPSNSNEDPKKSSNKEAAIVVDSDKNEEEEAEKNMDDVLDNPPVQDSEDDSADNADHHIDAVGEEFTNVESEKNIDDCVNKQNENINDVVADGQVENNGNNIVESREKAESQIKERASHADNPQEADNLNKTPVNPELGLGNNKENNVDNNKEENSNNIADKREGVIVQNMADKNQMSLKNVLVEKEKIQLNGILVNHEKENLNNISVNREKENLNNISVNREKENSNNILVFQQKEKLNNISANQQKESLNNISVSKEKENPNNISVIQQKEISNKISVNQEKENLKNNNSVNEKTKNSIDPIVNHEKETLNEALDDQEDQNLHQESSSINSNYQEQILDLTTKRREDVAQVETAPVKVKEEIMDEQLDHEIYYDHAMEGTSPAPMRNMYNDNCVIKKEPTDNVQQENIPLPQSTNINMLNLLRQQKNIVYHQEKNKSTSVGKNQPKKLSLSNVRIKRERPDDSLEENESPANVLVGITNVNENAVRIKQENSDHCQGENESSQFKTPKIYSVRSLASGVSKPSELVRKKSAVPPAKRIKMLPSTDKNKKTITSCRVSSSVLSWLKREDFGSSGTIEAKNSPEKIIDERVPRPVTNGDGTLTPIIGENLSPRLTNNENIPETTSKKTSPATRTSDKSGAEINNRVPAFEEKKRNAQVRVSDTSRDKYRKINEWVYERCKEYKNQGYRISSKILRGWALEAKRVLIYHNLNFHATTGWIKNFQKNYNITGFPDNLIVND